MLDALARWNRWGTAALPSGIGRDLTRSLVPFLDSRDVVALSGPRRAGKTTVLFQVMDLLTARGAPREAQLHVNFEEPALAPELGLALLDEIYRLYRVEVWPSGRAFLFLDEVQRVPGWERWVRSRSETEDLKVFVTGSSSALMSRELGTLLTGRHVTFAVRPLGFREFLRFRGVAVPPGARFTAEPPALQSALHDYLRWGGFPEVVLSESDARREVLLKQYFDDVLFKDVALRHSVRDTATLRALAVHLLTQTASRVSLQRLSQAFGVSVDLVRAYVAHLEEAFLVETVSYFSLKAAERQRNPMKVHAVDTGLRNAVCLSGTPDRGRLAETAAHAALRAAAPDGLYYWTGGDGGGEIDLVVARGGQATDLVQVVYEGLDDPATQRRELAALAAAARAFPGARRRLVTARLPAEPVGEAEVVPLWRFLAESAEPG